LTATAEPKTPDAEAEATDMHDLSREALRERVIAGLRDDKAKFQAIVKCKSTGQEDHDDVLFTAVKLRHSSYEFGTKVALGLKLAGGDLTERYKTRKHYVMQLREAPIGPGGMTVNLKLDGEVASVLVRCKELGRGVGGEAGPVALLTFDTYAPEGDDDEAPANKTSLSIAFDGDWMLDRFELGNIYRLAVLPAPKWLESEDKRRRDKEKAEKQAKKDAKAAKAAAAAVHPDQLGLFGDGPGDRKIEDGTTVTFSSGGMEVTLSPGDSLRAAATIGRNLQAMAEAPKTKDDEEAEAVAALFKRPARARNQPAEGSTDKTPPAGKPGKTRK
jgi:hypothetical protein